MLIDKETEVPHRHSLATETYFLSAPTDHCSNNLNIYSISCRVQTHERLYYM